MTLPSHPYGVASVIPTTTMFPTANDGADAGSSVSVKPVVGSPVASSTALETTRFVVSGIAQR